MKLIFITFLALVACAASMPTFQQAELEDQAYVLDKLGVNKENFLKVLDTIKEHGKNAGIKMIQDMLNSAKGVLKNALEKLLAQLQDNESYSLLAEEDYVLEKLGINKEKVMEILNAIKEHGKSAGIKLIKDFLQSAKGIFKDTLERLLSQLQDNDADAYIIDQIIDIEKLKVILNELMEHGKTIGKATLEQLLKISKGAARQMLEHLLEQLNKKQGETYIINKLVNVEQVKKAIAELLEHGKKVGRKALQQMLDIAKGAAREMLLKLMEQLKKQNENEAYSVIKIELDEEMKQKIREIITKLKNSKDAGIDELRKALAEARGAFKQLLEKILAKLADEQEAYAIDKLNEAKEKVMEVLKMIKEHGKNAGIKFIQDLLKSVNGIVKDTLEKLLAQLQD